MVCNLYEQFTTINSEIKTQIKLILENKQNRVLDPVYNESDIKYFTNKIKHLETIPQPEQRSEEWYEFRNNRLTASDFYKVFDTQSSQNNLILKKLKVNYVYLPNKKHIYNSKRKPKIKIHKNDQILCAKYRKGHFEGVLDVMEQFVKIINPSMFWK